MTTNRTTRRHHTNRHHTHRHRSSRRPRPSALRRADRGSVTAELALLTPLLVLLALAAVGLGRTESARIQVDSAARQGARAASLAPDRATAADRARRTVAQALAANTLTCTAGPVTVDLRTYQPGGLLTVTVSCAVDLRDVGMPGLPGTITLVASATSPIDRYREAGP